MLFFAESMRHPYDTTSDKREADCHDRAFTDKRANFFQSSRRKGARGKMEKKSHRIPTMRTPDHKIDFFFYFLNFWMNDSLNEACIHWVTFQSVRHGGPVNLLLSCHVISQPLHTIMELDRDRSRSVQ